MKIKKENYEAMIKLIAEMIKSNPNPSKMIEKFFRITDKEFKKFFGIDITKREIIYTYLFSIPESLRDYAEEYVDEYVEDEDKDFAIVDITDLTKFLLKKDEYLIDFIEGKLAEILGIDLRDMFSE